MINRTLAIILGGGVGSRLYPLTAKRSKPAVPVAGKYRLIDIPISNCLNSELKKMFILTQFNSASLNQHIKNAFHFDIFTKGFIDILAAEQTQENQEWFQGTADAVRQSIPHFRSIDFDYVIILSGDQLYQMDFRTILQDHIDNDADLTVATIPVNAKDAPGFGIMKVDKENEIQNFIEKPASTVLDDWKSPLDDIYVEQGKDYLASMGIYVFKKQVLVDLFNEMPTAIDFGKEIIPNAVTSKDYKVCSYPFGGYWTDIGSIPSYFEANLHLTEFLPEFNMYHNDNQLYSNARMLAPTKVFGTRFTNVLLSDGCIIHADEVERTVIGIRSRVGSRTKIKNAILLGCDYYQSLSEVADKPGTKLLGIGSDCVIENTIVDKNVRIGNNVTIIGHESLDDIETELYCIKEGLVIIKKSVVIPDGTRIGQAALSEAANPNLSTTS